nr:hypothetical protein [Tanacetum cinerariifolium]
MTTNDEKANAVGNQTDLHTGKRKDYDSNYTARRKDNKVLKNEWVERFMNYLEEQTDGEVMINSIKNGDQPLPRVTQVSIAGTSSNEQSLLKDKSINKTAKDLRDALARHMLGSEYGEQDRKAAVLYEYETFKATEGELLLDTYIRYLQVINDLKKCGYSKDNCELNFKFLNNLQPEWKQYATMMRKNKNLMDINIDALYNILKQNQGDVNDAMGLKKKIVMVTSDPLALITKKTKEGQFAKGCKKVKVKDYEYYKIKMLLAKKDKDEQVFLAEDQAWMESSNDSDQEINANMVFMAQIKKVLSDSEASSLSADDKIYKVSYYLSKLESESVYETSEYYDNTINYGLSVNDNDDQEIFHECENFHENLIESQTNHNESVVDHNDSEGIDKLIRKFNKKIVKCQERIEKEIQQSKDFKNQNKNLQDKYDVLKNQATTFEMNNKELNEQLKVLIEKNDDLLAQMKTVHMIMPSKDILYNVQKGIGFENPRYFEKVKDLRLTFYDEKVIGLGYTPMFLAHSNEALEIEKFKRARENKIEFAYDYGNLNASYVNEKINLSDDYFQEIINPDFDKIDSPRSCKSFGKKANLKSIESLKSKGFKSSEHTISELKNQSENNCQVFEKECDKVENPKVIAPRMFKLSVSHSVSPILMPKQSCDSKNVESKLKRKDKKKGSSNTSNVDLSSVSHLKLNKDVKRYSRKDLLSCNNSHPRETSSAYVCNDAMNVSCYSRLCDLFDENNLFIFDDKSVIISSVSKMPFKKKHHDFMNVHSKSNLNKSLPGTVHRWLPKMQPLAEPVAKWIPRIVQICLWIIDSGCSKHMMGNRALLTNFVEKFLGTVRFGNNDFAVIASYGDVTWVFFLHSKDEASEVIICFIKKTQVNLQLQVHRVRIDNGTEFKNTTLAKFFDEIGITQQFSTARTPQQNGVVERRNRTLVEAVRTMLSFVNLPLFLWSEAIATACFTQNHLIIQKRSDKTPYELINKRKTYIKFFRVFGCRCYILNDYEDVEKLKAKGDI